MDAGGDSVVRMPLSCIGGRLSLCDVEDTTQEPYLLEGSPPQTWENKKTVNPEDSRRSSRYAQLIRIVVIGETSGSSDVDADCRLGCV